MPPTTASEVSRRRQRQRPKAAAAVKASARRLPVSVRSQSLLDVVDSLIDKGVALDAEVVLGLADVDLLYLRVGALLAAADNVFANEKRSRRVKRTANPARLSAPSGSRPLLSSPVRTAATPAVPVKSARALVATSSETDDTSRSVIRLVLTLVEFIRGLLERQAVRRVREKTLTPAEVERLGSALMQLEATVHELADRHGLDPSDLNLDLGPLGTLR